jgi:hypothetical protein
MSEVTLETLREEFEAERQKAIEHSRSFAMLIFPSAVSKSDIVKLEERTVERWASGQWHCGPEITNAANIYIIARDYGLEAAMLYKLAWGGAA